MSTQYKITYMSIGKRIKSLRREKKITQIQLGRLVGVSGVTIGNYEKDEHVPKGEHLIALAKALETSPESLMSKDFNPAKNLPDQEQPSNYNQLRKVPLISSVAAGNWMEIIDNFHPGDADEWQPTTAKVSHKAFALKVEGKSMQNPNGHPTVPQGSIVIVDPEIEASNGKIVVAKLPNTNEATIKKLVIDGPLLYLEPLNPEFKMIQIDNECVIVGVVKQVILDI